MLVWTRVAPKTAQDVPKTGTRLPFSGCLLARFATECTSISSARHYGTRKKQRKRHNSWQVNKQQLRSPHFQFGRVSKISWDMLWSVLTLGDRCSALLIPLFLLRYHLHRIRTVLFTALHRNQKCLRRFCWISPLQLQREESTFSEVDDHATDHTWESL